MTQELYAVVGSEMLTLAESTHKVLADDTVRTYGIFIGREAAEEAWKANAWQTVDNALIRIFIVPLGIYVREKIWQHLV